jgi:hypothetical protein
MQVTMHDQMGNKVVFNKPLLRIVSLVPSQTELLCDLGLEPNIVGITKFCVHPFQLKSTKTIVGGTKKVHYEKIRLLNPDIVCNKEENTLEMVIKLREICPVWVTNIISIEDNWMIADFGKLFNKRTEAQKWNDKLAFALADFCQFVADKPIRKPPTLYGKTLIWQPVQTIISMKCSSSTISRTSTKTNPVIPKSKSKKIRLEGDPDLVFLSSEPYPFKEEDAFEMAGSHHAKTVFVDGEMFSWYGSRMSKL